MDKKIIIEVPEYKNLGCLINILIFYFGILPLFFVIFALIVFIFAVIGCDLSI